MLADAKPSMVLYAILL